MRARAAERSRRWYAANKDRARDAGYKYRYGISLDQWTALFERQGRACAICRTDLSTAQGRAVHTDHDHKTGRVRGILCHRCNRGMTFFDHYLARAVLYADPRRRDVP